jgi:hypothetical protein
MKTYANLLKAEHGENPAYAELIVIMTRWAESPKVYPCQFIGAILAEIERREDWSQLAHALEKMKPENPPSPLFIPGIGSECSQKTRFIATLLRGAPLKARPFLEGLDPGQPDSRKLLLDVAVQSESPHAEWILRKLQPLIAAMKKDAQQWDKSSESRMWGEALRRTGTPWCRDALVIESDWRSLALLGDRRTLSAKAKSNYGTPCPPPPSAYLMFGEMRTAARWAMERSGHPNACGLLASMQAGADIPTGRWPHGQLQMASETLLVSFSKLSPPERLALLSVAAGNPELISKEFIELALKDEFGPVKLSLLMYLLEHPRGGFEAILKTIEAKDPLPWCRRVAHEVLAFHPDPLEPERGIKFELPI